MMLIMDVMLYVRYENENIKYVLECVYVVHIFWKSFFFVLKDRFCTSEFSSHFSATRKHKKR
jgi:hypothetical protein